MQRLAEAVRYFIFKDFKKIKPGGFATRATAILSGIQGLFGFCVSHELSPFNAKNQVVISFKEVKDP
jgi:hypothetical protein